MIEQYVLLASRYKDVSYADIKQYVYNSINYSFIQNEKGKKTTIKGFRQSFYHFWGQFSFKIDQNEYQTDRHWQNG
jgi:adenosine deaminase/adenosine deaminase CECR1